MVADEDRPSRAGVPEQSTFHQVEELVYQPYLALAERIKAAKDAGLPQAEVDRFQNELTRIFLEKHTEAELPYIVDGLHPSVDMMRTLMLRIHRELTDIFPEEDIADIRVGPQSSYQSYAGQVNGVIHLAKRTGTFASGEASYREVSLPIEKGHLISEWPTRQAEWHKIDRTQIFEVHDAKAYGVIHLVEDILIKPHLVVAGEMSSEVDGKTFDGVLSFFPEPQNQTWSGSIYKRAFDGTTEDMLVIHGHIKDELSSGEPITTVTHAAHHKGELSCVMQTGTGLTGRCHLLVNGQEIDTIQGRAIADVHAFWPGRGTDYSGVMTVLNMDSLAQNMFHFESVVVIDGVIDPELSKQIEAQNLNDLKILLIRDDGIYGWKHVPDPTANPVIFPIMKGKLVETIDGRPLEAATQISFSEDGQLSAIICFKSEKESPTWEDYEWGFVIDGQLVTVIDGRIIKWIEEESTFLWDRTLEGLTGKVKLDGENRIRQYFLGEWHYE